MLAHAEIPHKSMHWIMKSRVGHYFNRLLIDRPERMFKKLYVSIQVSYR